MQAKDRIFVALDVNSAHEACLLAEKLSPHVGGFKIGLQLGTSMLTELITAESQAAAEFKLTKIRCLFSIIGSNFFWDWKFNDIPNTVGGASAAVARLKARMFNLHASAGFKAMQAAVAKKEQSLVLAVTVLTSLEESSVNLIFGAPSEVKVLQFARSAQRAGCDGIVCSPQELAFLGKETDLNGLLKVTPGIRDTDSPPDDQRRTMSAAEAIKAGADYLVIGRPITAAPDPVRAANKFAGEIASALEQKRAA